jgi:hypothetical protein
MDKVLKYQQIICTILEDYAKIQGIPAEIKSYTLFDKEAHHYQLLSMGWFRQEYTYNVAMHLDIIDEKIWIQQNNSDAHLSLELIENGVAKEDIVLGFIQPTRQDYAAVAA